MLPPSIRADAIASGIAEVMSSRNFAVDESPPFLSIHACMAIALRSFKEGTPRTLPLRSWPLLNGELFATTSATRGFSAV